MSDYETEAMQRAARVARLRIGLTTAALLVATAVGVVLVFRFAAEERARDLHAWQIRLGIVADSRIAEVDKWLAQQRGEVRGLAENPSLQVYMTQLALARQGGDAIDTEMAEASYLANLLVATAARAGFEGRVVGPEIGANVARSATAGLALLGGDGRVLVATPEFPALDAALRGFALGTQDVGGGISAMFLGPAKTPSLAFVAPVFGVQADPGDGPPLGYAVGITEVSDALYPLLRQPGTVEQTAEAVLVERRGASVVYLSPLRGGAAPLVTQLAADTQDLAAGFAVANPGGFALKRDYDDREVLVVARPSTQTDWTLLYKIDRAEALADSETRLKRLSVTFLLLIMVVLVAIIAVWRHGSSRRAGEAAARFRTLAQRFEHQGNVLRLVTDSQSGAIFIADRGGGLRFANAGAARLSGIPQDDIVGKTLQAVLGQEEGQRVLRLNRLALEDRQPQSASVRRQNGAGVRVLESEHIPLPQTIEVPESVLVVERDITDAVRERERREHTLRQLVNTLVTVVDRRDPYAAHHSTRVALVARAVANEMGLSAEQISGAEIAGELMNLGKILVPSDVLTKTEALSTDERQMIRDSILTSAELVQGIDFDGPVVDTLRQLQERWDGQGYPGGLQGEAIIVTARVVAVANAFVGMISPRAFRDAMTFDKVGEILMGDAGKAYDRRVVAALLNYLDNRGGREAWSDFSSRPADVHATTSP